MFVMGCWWWTDMTWSSGLIIEEKYVVACILAVSIMSLFQPLLMLSFLSLPSFFSPFSFPPLFSSFSGGMFALASLHATDGKSAHYMDIGRNITKTCYTSYQRTCEHAMFSIQLLILVLRHFDSMVLTYQAGTMRRCTSWDQRLLSHTFTCGDSPRTPSTGNGDGTWYRYVGMTQITFISHGQTSQLSSI